MMNVRDKPVLTCSIFLLYMSLAPATAVKLLASAVAWSKKLKINQHNRNQKEMTQVRLIIKRSPITNLQHGLWVRQLLSLVDLYVRLQEWGGREAQYHKRVFCSQYNNMLITPSKNHDLWNDFKRLVFMGISPFLQKYMWGQRRRRSPAW